ncbi:F-box domain-containing protein [Meloidogyne graminicola]|uniref:F-box domain-containing protein n=1 Tax=Meloidogyne graminicola TaxID=189291 RepID=A0A8S9ZQ33_9BILA|nr:F-box domain-containing protein [Meloidogyne graminicola]
MDFSNVNEFVKEESCNDNDYEQLNESTFCNESVEFRGDMDVSFNSDNFSVSFQEISMVLRARPDINVFYRTPCSGSNRFARRSSSVRVPIDYLSKLPDFLLLQIFKHLNKNDLVRIMRTCRYFSHLGMNSMFWQFMNLGKRLIDEFSLHSLLDRKMEILRLAEALIESPQFISGYDLSNIELSNLTHLDLSHATYENSNILQRFFERCRCLVALSLEGCSLLNDAICHEIGKNIQLRFLDLVYVNNLSSNGIYSILSNCRSLEELNCGWADVGIGAITLICKLAPPSLLRLNLSGFRLNEEMNDENVKLLCSSCPNLKEIDLSDNELITEHALEAISPGLKNLNRLTLSRCYAIEPMSFVSLKNLEVLNIFGCITNEGIELLRERLYPTLIDHSPICTIAKPTVGSSVASIWGKQTRDRY